MKNNQTVEGRADSAALRRAKEPGAGSRLNAATCEVCSPHASRLTPHSSPVTRHPSSATRHASAFTLIELLTVIGIIAVIAGFVLVVAGPVKKRQYIFNTQAEMAKLETAIERYHAAYGFYPPSPTTPPTVGNSSSLFNQLFYELEGTTGDGINNYTNLDGSDIIKATDVPKAFPGIGGFMNCTKPGAGEDSAVARNFLPDLKPNQIGRYCTNTFNGTLNTFGVTLIICSVGGPDATYQPLGQQNLNPWRYNSSSPINNPGSYDLWVQLVIGGKTNLICNWTEQVQIGITNLP
ncbi:MAG: type II secretion system protein [Verrucomicrobiota bacterium]|jgi:prepilin-type N-terminal cleavage/methylation domain-containing protein